MANSFSPVEELQLFCRHCQKVLPHQLERSIAGSGRVVDRASTFEYYCEKCKHTSCFNGEDLLAAKAAEEEGDVREYAAKDKFLIGETIRHPSFGENGTVVWKEAGSPNRILVQFEKLGTKKLVEELS